MSWKSFQIPLPREHGSHCERAKWRFSLRLHAQPLAELGAALVLVALGLRRLGVLLG